MGFGTFENRYPLALALSASHGWFTVRGLDDVRGEHIEGVIYLRETPEDVVTAIDQTIQDKARQLNLIPPNEYERERYFPEGYVHFIFGEFKAFLRSKRERR